MLKIIRLSKIGVLMTVSAGLFLPTLVLGGEYTDQAKAQLALIKLAALSDGWEETHKDKFDRMDNGSSNSFSFKLKEGTKYKVISVCDKDCSDLDLALYDEDGHKISVDVGGDDMPIVEANPRWTGKFTLKVKMASCKNNPCFYGISILGK